MPRRSFRYDPVSKSMVEIQKTSSAFDAPDVVGDIEPFVSPVDGTIIKSRSHLRDYMGEKGLVHYDEVKDGQGKVVDRYAEARNDQAMRERMWEGLDRAQRTGRGPRHGN